MNTNYIEVRLEPLGDDGRELVAALLGAAGYEGFAETETGLLAYVQEAQFNELELAEVMAPFNIQFFTSVIAPRNWNEEWEQSYQPVQVGDFVQVRAHFHPAAVGVEHEIIITPKMSFGTGHHATTWQMMNWMQQLQLAGKKVFDFGTGTGVLALLAEKLGAAAVLATDNDEWSIENTKENLQRNAALNVEVMLADTPPSNQHFDVILANINRHVLLAFMDQLAALLQPGAQLLMSGFYETDNPLLINAAAHAGLQLAGQSNRQQWSCLLFTKAVTG